MSTLFSSTLPDEPMTGVITDDDEIEIAVTDEPESPIEVAQQRRGQNEASDEEGEEPPHQQAQDDSDPDLADLENPSIKSRIMRERRLAREARERMLAVEEHNQRALYDAELRNVAIQRDSAKMAVDGIDLRIRTAVEALKIAKTEGDVSSEVELSNQLRELDRARQTVLDMQNGLPSEEQLRGRFEEYRNRRRAELQASPRDAGGVKATSPMAQKWADANTWVNKPENSGEQAYLVALGDRLVQEEGLNPNSQEFYTELSKRMAKRFPELNIRDVSGRSLTAKPAQAKPAGPPVASARVTTQRTQNGKSRTRVELDGNDRRMMRIMGFDPADKGIRERFAREKLARLRSEQAGRS
jgi:hypothetical protein